MALPILNATRYATTLPSTGEEIYYRPYVVKEEKIMMIALESKEEKQIMDAMLDVIEACVLTEGFNLDELTTFDVEWLFLKLRARSVGEKAELKLKCTDEDCNAITEVLYNLDEIKVDGELGKSKMTIEIADGVGVVMKYPPVKLIRKYDAKSMETIDGAFSLVAGCIDQVFDEENVYEAKEQTPEEVKDFLDSLSTIQFKSLADFVGSQPTVHDNMNWKCITCEKENSMELRGLQSFFT